MQKPETKIQRAIRKHLQRLFPRSFWFKVHGGFFQKAGLPDLLGCIYGLYIGIEVKRPNDKNSKTSGKQDAVIEQITDAGGLAFSSTSIHHSVKTIINYLLANDKITKKQAKRLSERSIKLRIQKKESRLILRNEDWQMHN